MRRLLLALALNSVIATTCAYAQSPPCNAGVHTTFNEKIIPVQNGNITYCISDFGWSDTWLLGTPPGYNKLNDILSGDDAFNLKYDQPAGGFGPGSGWMTPSLDQGTLSAQDAPGWTVRNLWSVVTPVHYTGATHNATESVIQNADGLRITIDAFAPPGAFGVQISFTIVNTSAGTINNLRLADYFNLHPNGSDNNQNLLGTTTFDGNCIRTVGQPISILDGFVCGLFAPVRYEVGYAVQKGNVAPVWVDVGNELYDGSSGPVGPDDTAGAMQWSLGSLAPGQTVRFAVGKNVVPFGPPVLAKVFVPASIPVNGISALTFTVTNPNTQTLTGIGFSDALPANVLVATPLVISGTCGGGIISATAGGSQIQLSGATLAGAGNCTFSVNVTATAFGSYLNTTSPINSNEGGQGNSASATLSVPPPPVITKAFTPASIPVAANSTLAITIKNPATITLTGIGFTDAFPPGVAVAPAPGLTNTCGGTLSGFTAGSTTIGLAGASLIAGGTCTITVSVVGSTPGNKLNITGPVTSVEAGNGNTASTTLTVVLPPSITKAFSSPTISAGGTSVLTFTIANPIANPVTLTGVAFSDTFPAGVVVAPTPGTANTCGGALNGFAAGSSAVSLTGATLAPGASCSIAVTVVGSLPGTTKNNVTTPVTSIEGGPGNTASATLTLTVVPPSITKTFNPKSIQQGSTSVLTFTLSNANPSAALTGVGFSDPFPAGVAVAATPGTTNTCGGTLSGFAAGSANIGLTGGTIVAGGTCTITVTVVGNTLGPKINVTSVITSTEGGPGNTATDTLTVTPQIVPPSIAKTFNPSSILVGGSSVLTFTLTNPNAALPLSGIGFTDPFPAGVALAQSPAATTTCGITLTGFTAGATSVSVTGISLAGGASCTISATVVGSTAGTKTNTTSVVTSSEAGSGNAASAVLTVIGPPSIGKAFNPPSIVVGATSLLTFTLVNPNASVALTGVGFTDTLPAGVALAAPPGTTNTCGGTLTGFTAASTAVSLVGGAIPANGTCFITVTVVGNTLGQKNNVTTIVTSTEGGPGNIATATLTVTPPPLPPSIAKVFNPASTQIGATSVLTFTLSNPNVAPNLVTLTGVGFSDTFPGGVAVASSPNTTNTCGGTLSGFTAGSATISLTGGTIPGGGSCSISVTVLASSGGTKHNVTTVVTSTEGGNGNTASADLVVGVLSPILIKAFGDVGIGLNAVTTLTFNLSNPNPDTTLTHITYTDPLPAGLLLANPPGVHGTCDPATITAVAGEATIRVANAVLPPLGSCTFTVNITGVHPGQSVNVTSAVLSAEAPPGAPAVAQIVIGSAYQVTYLANLDKGDSFIDITNTGSGGASLQSGTSASVTGSLCANVYVFSPDEQLISCCSCPVTPNGLVSLSANLDLVNNSLTPVVPTSVVVKLVASTPVGNSCTNSASAVTSALLTNAATAFSTTLHQTPSAGVGSFAPVEKPFSGATLSTGELARLTGLCNFILANGSGFGVCRACRLGGLGAERK